MSTDDIAYYRERVAKERKAAEAAKTPEVAAAHLNLVTMYENLVECLCEALAAERCQELSSRTDRQGGSETMQ